MGAWKSGSLGALALLATVHGQSPRDAPAPAFRASTEAVYVIATVTQKDGTLVTDLNEADFEISDNGDTRPITVFRNDPVPFAVTIMLDVSGSMLENIPLMRRGVEELVRQFQPGDRANIGTFQSLPVVGPYFTSHAPTLANWVSASMGGIGAPCLVVGGAARMMGRGGGSAVWDALLCGINTVYADSETPRRVVLIVSDGQDNASIYRPPDVVRRATDLGMMIYAIGLRGMQGLDKEALQELAEQTGGGYFALTESADLPKTFARIAEELRHQYVFGFSPASAPDKRHKIAVNVKREGLKVHSRQVHVDVSPVTATNGIPMMPVLPAQPSPLEVAGVPPPARPNELALTAPPAGPRGALAYALDLFEQGDWSGAPAIEQQRLVTLVNDGLRRDAPAWVAERGAEHADRRRLAAATYVLTLLDGMNTRSLWQAEQAASGLLEAACTFLRQGPLSLPERLWYVASFGLLERSAPAGVMLKHLEHAEARFPAEGRWALIRAVAEEKRLPIEFLANGLPVFPAGTSAMVQVYARASAIASVHAEAETRWGRFEFAAGHNEEALVHYDRAGEPDEVALRYWLYLFKGQALERAGRLPDAIVAYRRAAEAVPLAQAAGFALAGALVINRQTSEAAAHMLQMLNSGPVDDPWLYYVMPDGRFWPVVMQDLRKITVQ